MPTLILTPRQTGDAQALWRAAIARGWDVERLATWRIPDGPRDEPFLYAEALFGPTLAEQLGVTLLEAPEDWLPKLPEAYRQRAVTLSTLGEAQRSSQPAFVKPPNDKSFPAAVYEAGTLPTTFDPEMAVLVAEPVRFTSEFRVFVLDRTVRAFSLYARDGEPVDPGHEAEEERGLLAFVSRLLADAQVHLPRACVVDVGPIEGRGWAVVELNAAWGAGIYGCDPDAVLDVVCAATVGAD